MQSVDLLRTQFIADFSISIDIWGTANDFSLHDLMAFFFLDANCNWSQSKGDERK